MKWYLLDWGIEFKSFLIENLINTFIIFNSLSEADVSYDNPFSAETFKSKNIEFVYSSKFETHQKLKQELEVYMLLFNDGR